MSAASIKTYLLTRAPTYSTETRLDDLITYAMTEVSATAFGDQYDKAVALLVLHQLAKEESDAAAAGPVVGKREGDLAMTYARPYAGTQIDDLDGTKWGQEFKRLREANVFPVMNRVSGYNV
jgi:hypothetical protein